MEGVLIGVFMLIDIGTFFTHMFMEIPMYTFGGDSGNEGRNSSSFVGNLLDDYYGNVFCLSILTESRA